MKKNIYIKRVMSFCFLIFMVLPINIIAQVGIGTTTPASSSVFDITSTTKGMLTPRMTTAQRTAIASPDNGLIVYDIDVKAFYYYDTATSTWIKVYGDKDGRLNFKRIKSTDVLATVLAAELAAGGGVKYLLDTAILYEINGAVMVDFPIELNNAYVVGLDSSDDKLIKVSGDLFTGTTGGSIRVLTLVAIGGNVFNITGTGSIGAGTQTQSLIYRDCIIANSSNVGKIENFSLVFTSIVNFSGNTTGIIYKDISKLLITNAGWFGNNSGTYETLQGTFGLIGKIGGFSEVVGVKVGFDVSSNPIITGDAVLREVVFTGALTSGKFVNGYTVGSYSGYNFNNKWEANCTGIPLEGDAFATGSLYLNRTLAFPTTTVLTTGFTKMPGTTIATNLYKTSSLVSSRLLYEGTKTRTFSVFCSLSFDSGGGGVSDFLFFFVKWNAAGTISTILTSTETYIDTNSGNVQSFPISGTVTLRTGEYVELAMVRLSGSDKTLTFRSMNMSLK